METPTNTIGNYLDIIFDEFKERIVHVNFTQSFTKSISEAALINLNKEYEITKEQGRESSIKHMTNMICNDILRDQKIVIGSKSASYEEHQKILLLQHNRQYQWLLVEAYEAFEDYLAKLYAYFGYRDNDFWEKKDFKKLLADEIKTKSLDWFIKEAKNKKKRPESILEQMNKNIPSLDKILVARKREDPLVDYEFTVVLVSRLRHRIVHRRGYADKNKFISSLLAAQLLATKLKNEKHNYTDLINAHFGSGELDGLIALLEVPDPSSKLSGLFIDRLGILLGGITSYAMLLHGLANNYFAKGE